MTLLKEGFFLSNKSQNPKNNNQRIRTNFKFQFLVIVTWCFGISLEFVIWSLDISYYLTTKTLSRHGSLGILGVPLRLCSFAVKSRNSKIQNSQIFPTIFPGTTHWSNSSAVT